MSRTDAAAHACAAGWSPEDYAGDAIVAMAEGRPPLRPLTDWQERQLVQNGFLARRGDRCILTRKGEDLALDIAAEIAAGCGA